MGLFDWLSRRVNNEVQKGMTTYSVGNPVVYTHIDTDKAISEGYNSNTAVFAILNKDAEKFGSVPSYVYKANDEESEEQDNELSKLINKPNEYQGQDSFRMLLRLYRKLTGEAFVWLNRGDLGKMDDKARLKKPVLEMYVLPSDCVNIIPDPSNLWGCLGYQLDVNGKQIPLSKSDVIHWKSPSLNFDASTREHLRGQSPLSSGYKTLQQNNSATDAAVRMYQNDGAKGVMANETLDKLTPQQRSQIDGVINKKINNNDVKGAVATLQGKWSYLDLGKSNTDLGLLEGKNVSMKELCFLFDVPYELFDPSTTFANKEMAMKAWVSNSIIPSCKQFDDELNRVLPMAFGLTDYIKSDFSELPEMQEDMGTKISNMVKGPFRPNDILELQGYDRDPNPIYDDIWIPGGFVPGSMQGESMDSIARSLNDQGLA